MSAAMEKAALARRLRALVDTNGRLVVSCGGGGADIIAAAIHLEGCPAEGDRWRHPSEAIDGDDVLLWRQDGHRADVLYGVREVGSYEDGEWYGQDGDAIARPRAWRALPGKPTIEELAAISAEGGK